MLDPLANHLSLQDHTHKHIIILMKSIYLVSILIAEMIMMILCFLVIQCGNDYISRYLWIILCNLLLCIYFDMFLPTTLVFMLSLYVLCVRWYVLNMWYMNIHVYIFLKICHDFSFFEFSMWYFTRIVRVRSESSRPIRLGAGRVGGRDRDFEPWHVSMLACFAALDICWVYYGEVIRNHSNIIYMWLHSVVIPISNIIIYLVRFCRLIMI